MKTIIKLFKKYYLTLLFIFLTITSAMFFIYTLGYSTGWAMADSAGGNIGKIVKEYAYNYNQLFLKLTIILLVILLLNYAFSSNKRRYYRISNFILLSLHGILNLVIGILFLNAKNKLLPMFEKSFTEDEETWKFIFDLNNRDQNDIINTLNFSNTLFILSIISFLFVVMVLVYKVFLYNRRKKFKEYYNEFGGVLNE